LGADGSTNTGAYASTNTGAHTITNTGTHPSANTRPTQFRQLGGDGLRFVA